MLIALQRFGGVRPRVHPRLLRADEAQIARNCKLWNGTLRPWFKPLLTEVATNPGPLQSIYRYTDNGYWLHWDKDVDVARGPVAGTQRLYWTGDGAPKFGNAEVIAGVTTLVQPALAGANFLLVNNALGFKPGEHVTVTLDNAMTHTSQVTTVQYSLNRINIALAVPSDASTGNAIANADHGYPHASYPMGVPAPTAPLVATENVTANRGTVVGLANSLGEVIGNSTTASNTFSVDLTGVDSDGEQIDFEIEAGFTGKIASVQSRSVTLTVIRDPAGANETIYEKVFTVTYQGPALPDVNSTPDEIFLANVLYSTIINQGSIDSSTEQNLHATYTPSDGMHNYRLTISQELVAGGGFDWTYSLRLTARRGGLIGLKLSPADHGLEAGDKVQFGAIIGTGSLTDLNKDPVLISSVSGDSVFVDSQASGSYTSGGTWEQVWDQTDLETRNYVYTYVATLDSLDMEGPPSPPSNSIDVGDGRTVTLTGFIDPTSLADGRPYRAVRLYRLGVGANSESYLFDKELPVNPVSYIDTARGDELDEVLPSETWLPPPDDLAGLTELPNGLLAGFRTTTNEVCFCAPDQPHAWPAAYRRAMMDKIVGIGAYGTSLLVGTLGRPTVIVGADPAQLVEEHIEVVYPCLSKRGFVDMGYGILYPSLSGLVYVAQGVAKSITAELFSDEQWAALRPETFVAAKYANRYICFYDTGTERGGFILDPLDPTTSLVFLDLYANEVWSDPRSDRLYLVVVDPQGDEEIVEWNADQGAAPDAYTWRSKETVTGRPERATVLKVDSELYPVTVNIYGDGRLYDSLDVVNSEPVRLSDKGGLARKWELEVLGGTGVEAAYLASNMRTLASNLTGNG